MQKWLPDELTDLKSMPSVANAKWNAFESAEECSLGAGANEARFQKESRFADPSSLLSNLTQDERALIFELAEQDVAREYEDREAELKTQQEEALAAARAEYEQRLSAWSTEFGAVISSRVEEDLGEIGKASARLAVQLAEKIVRELVPVDHEILVRAIQTALFKIPGNQPIRIIVHPEDAAWLRDQDDLVAKLNISEITEDRRIESGGCLLQSGVREWDATLSGQLESLEEVVREAIATAGADPSTTITKEDHEPGVE